MRQTPEILQTFYSSPMGRLAHSNGMRRISALWPDLEGCSVMGFGFCDPYLSPYAGTCRRLISVVPGGEGALNVSTLRTLTLRTEEDRLPFAPETFDRVLVAHGLEDAPNAGRLLAELYRVTKTEGRIVIMAANRGGMWARSDHSPFGSGRPYSRRQLSQTLRDARFTPTIWAGALYAPPFRRIRPGGFASTCEKFGETVWPGFSGLVLVEAVKRLYANVPKAGATVSAKQRLSGAIPVAHPGNVGTRRVRTREIKTGGMGKTPEPVGRANYDR